ncbi:MAG TPA: hypothetical protein VIS96_16850 [Terrimicrobiaceae bacterium]
MKISLSVHKIPSLLKIGFAAAAVASLSACASSSWIKQAHSVLPIEAVDFGSGTIRSFRAHETSDRLYVAGHAKPHRLTRPTHVDIQLIAADGRIVAEKIDDLDSPQHPRSASGRREHQFYVASFPLNEARQAVKIRIVDHGDAHSEGNS